MEILQGQSQNQTVDIDPIFVWKSCWTRAVALFQILLPCTWTLSTAYDFFCKTSGLVKTAREAASVSVPDVAIAAAACATKAAPDARTFAVAAAAYRPIRDCDAAAGVQAIQVPDVEVIATVTASVVETIFIYTAQIGGTHSEAAAAVEEVPQL